MSDEQERLRVCSFESRRQSEMQSLIARFGGEGTVVASMQEVPLDANESVPTFVTELLAGRVDIVVFMTGVGARALFEAVEERGEFPAFREALERCQIAVRGPKPFAVLREYKLRVDVRAPEPNTWRELLTAMEAADVALGNRTVAVQEYGIPSQEFYEELQARGANVQRVTIYRWALPDDTAPLEQAIRDTVAGKFDVLLWTSANQVKNVLDVAERLSLRSEWLAAANDCVIGSIGPTASEMLRDQGLPTDLEPSHPKMAPLVRETLEAAAEILSRKRSDR